MPDLNFMIRFLVPFINIAIVLGIACFGVFLYLFLRDIKSYLEFNRYVYNRKWSSQWNKIAFWLILAFFFSIIGILGILNRFGVPETDNAERVTINSKELAKELRESLESDPLPVEPRFAPEDIVLLRNTISEAISSAEIDVDVNNPVFNLNTTPIIIFLVLLIILFFWFVRRTLGLLPLIVKSLGAGKEAQALAEKVEKENRISNIIMIGLTIIIVVIMVYAEFYKKPISLTECPAFICEPIITPTPAPSPTLTPTPIGIGPPTPGQSPIVTPTPVGPISSPTAKPSPIPTPTAPSGPTPTQSPIVTPTPVGPISSPPVEPSPTATPAGPLPEASYEEYFPVEADFPPFLSAQAKVPKDENDRLNKAICDARQKLLGKNATVAIVVGMHDKRALSKRARHEFPSNRELAQARGAMIKGLLMNVNPQCLNQNTMKSVKTLIGKPKIFSEPANMHKIKKEDRDKYYEKDRIVEIYGVRQGGN